jgi:gamma-butyrobetaine dioxygenase
LCFCLTSPTELSLRKSDGSAFAIHPLWLRECCQDAASIDRNTRQRLYDPSDLDLDVPLAAVSESPPGQFHVRFSDGHEAHFSAAESFAEAALDPGDADCPAPQLWSAALTDLPRALWREAPSDAELFEWLTQFLRLRFIILTGVPAERGAILKVAAAFGFTRSTNFGALFDVRSMPEASDLAYTSIALDPHTDNPYRFPGSAVRFRHTDPNTELVASAARIDLDVTGECVPCTSARALILFRCGHRPSSAPITAHDRSSTIHCARRNLRSDSCLRQAIFS